MEVDDRVNALRVGAASVPITPTAGREMAGYAARQGPADGVLDELSCRVVTFTVHDTTLAFVVLDLLYVTADLATVVCAEVASALGVERKNILISATHTHCGPALGGAGDDLPAAITAAAARAAVLARVDARRAALHIGEVSVAGLVHNRRDPSGPLDEAATVLVAVDDDGQTITTLISMACHPTILVGDTTSYSADYPGALRDAVEQLCGGTAVFVQGFAGDVNPLYADHSADDMSLFGHQVGARVADLVLSVRRAAQHNFTINLSMDATLPAPFPGTARRLSVASLRASLTTVPVAVKPPTDPAHIRDELAKARSAVDEASSEQERAAAVRRAQSWWIEELMAGRPRFLCVDFPDDESAALPVQVFRIGDQLSVAALPGEPMTATAMQLREAIAGDVILVGYAHQAASYLPSREEFTQDGYEVGSSRYQPGTVEALAEAAVALVREDAGGT